MSDCWLRVLMRGLLHFLEIYLASGRCLSSPVSTWKACFLRNLLRGFQCLSLAFHPLTTLLAPKQNTQSLLNYSCSIPEKYYFIESLKITECIVAGTSPNTDTARESGEGSQLPPAPAAAGSVPEPPGRASSLVPEQELALSPGCNAQHPRGFKPCREPRQQAHNPPWSHIQVVCFLTS